MAFDLDDEELEMTRVYINQLEPKNKDVKNNSIDKFNYLSSNKLKEDKENGK